MENDNTILTENDIKENVVTEFEEEPFEISEEAKEQSKKFFKFGSKPKKEKRKFESFEIVKTYTPKEKVKENNDFDKILEVSNNREIEEETVSTSSSTKKQQVKLKVRPQGKLILILISVIIIMLSSLSIYNAVKISKLNSDISNVTNEITIQDLNIDKAIKNLDKLNADATSSETAQELGMNQAESKTEIQLYERKPISKPNNISNWFNNLCNFLSKLFGG